MNINWRLLSGKKILTAPKCKWFKNHSRFCGMLRSWGYFLQSPLKWPSWDMATPRRQFSRSLANNRWVKVWRRWQRKDVIIVNENHRRYRALECIREGIKDMFEKHPELGVKVRVMSYFACYISGVIKVYRYIYCNRRERLVAGLGIWHESFLVRSSATELSRTWVVYSRVGDMVLKYTSCYMSTKIQWQIACFNHWKKAHVQAFIVAIFEIIDTHSLYSLNYYTPPSLMWFELFIFL